MGIRLRADVNTRPIDLFTDYFDDFAERVRQHGQDAVDAHRDDLLSELKAIPGPPKYPIQWTSEKQRRAFFATNGFGGGIPTTRSGRLPDGWQIITFEANATFTVFITNQNPAAKYVYGPLANISPSPRQRFHAQTGWPDAWPIVQRYTALILDDMVARIRADLGEFGNVTGVGTSSFTG